MLGSLLGSISASLKAHSAGLGAAITLLISDLNTGHHVTAQDWIAIAGAYLGVGAAVHIIPNVPKIPVVGGLLDDLDLTAQDVLAVPSADEPDDLAGTATVHP